MSLLTLVQNPLNEIGLQEVPASIVGNNNPTATQSLALANRSLQQVAREINWQPISRKATITTVSGQGEYALPSDFKSIVDQTVWNTSQRRRLFGAETPQDWALLKSWSTTNTVALFYRIFRSESSNVRVFHLHPTSLDANTITYEYISNALTQSAGGTLQGQTFLADTDEALFDEDLLSLCFKWRYLKSKGLPYAEELRDYEEAVAYEASATGNKVIDMGADGLASQRILSVPDGGYGN